MKTVVLDAETLGADIDVSVLGEDLVIYGSTAPEDVASRITDCEVVAVNKVKLGANNLSSAKKLKLICVAATGYDNIDTDYCKTHGIAVCNVRGYSSDSVAQLTAAMVLSLSVHLNEYGEYVASGKYTAGKTANCLTPVYHELAGKTWGIVGLGNIGRRTARIAEALGCDVLAFKRTPVDDYKCVSLETLMEKSDIVSVHLPASDGTKAIISGDMIARMKKSAIFINVARGTVVDEEALTEALLNGQIGGVGIDVYSEEPFGGEHCFNKIKNMSNVILTPHIAWGAYEARKRCLNEMRENIDSFQNGGNRNRIV